MIQVAKMGMAEAGSRAAPLCLPCPLSLALDRRALGRRAPSRSLDQLRQSRRQGRIRIQNRHHHLKRILHPRLRCHLRWILHPLCHLRPGLHIRQLLAAAPLVAAPLASCRRTASGGVIFIFLGCSRTQTITHSALGKGTARTTNSTRIGVALKGPEGPSTRDSNPFADRRFVPLSVARGLSISGILDASRIPASLLRLRRGGGGGPFDCSQCPQRMRLREGEDKREGLRLIKSWCLQAANCRRKREHGAEVPRLSPFLSDEATGGGALLSQLSVAPPPGAQNSLGPLGAFLGLSSGPPGDPVGAPIGTLLRPSWVYFVL